MGTRFLYVKVVIFVPFHMAWDYLGDYASCPYKISGGYSKSKFAVATLFIDIEYQNKFIRIRKSFISADYTAIIPANRNAVNISDK